MESARSCLWAVTRAGVWLHGGHSRRQPDIASGIGRSARLPQSAASACRVPAGSCARQPPCPALVLLGFAFGRFCLLVLAPVDGAAFGRIEALAGHRGGEHAAAYLA